VFQPTFKNKSLRMKNLTLKKKIIFTLYGTFATGVILVVILFSLISSGMLGFMPSFEELENPQPNWLPKFSPPTAKF